MLPNTAECRLIAQPYDNNSNILTTVQYGKYTDQKHDIWWASDTAAQYSWCQHHSRLHCSDIVQWAATSQETRQAVTTSPYTYALHNWSLPLTTERRQAWIG